MDPTGDESNVAALMGSGVYKKVKNFSLFAGTIGQGREYAG